MVNRLLADGIVVLHFLFIAFVVLGGVLVLRWPRLAWVHLPAACWGAAIELSGWICPLTPLENRFRQAAGEAWLCGQLHRPLSLADPLPGRADARDPVRPGGCGDRRQSGSVRVSSSSPLIGRVVPGKCKKAIQTC